MFTLCPHAAADEVSQETQTASHQPLNPAAPDGLSSSPASSKATSPASVLNGMPNGDAPSMPPPVDPNTPKYRLAHTDQLIEDSSATPCHLRRRRLQAGKTTSLGSDF